MAPLELNGTEALTVEIGGHLPEDRAREILGPDLDPELRAGAATVSLLIFQMRGLQLGRLPFPSFDYGEALWRIGLHFAGGPAWFAVACDLDRPAVRWAGRRIVRYPVRRAILRFSPSLTPLEGGTRIEVLAAGERLLLQTLGVGATRVAEPPRRAIVRAGATLFEIPWREDPAPVRHETSIDLLDADLVERTLGPGAVLDAMGLLHRGRRHHCGLAHRLGRRG